MTRDELHRLIWTLEHGHPIGIEARKYLTVLVKAKIRRPSHRPTSSGGKPFQVARTVLLHEELEGCKREAAVAHAMELHEVGREYVFKCLKAHLKRPKLYEVINVAGVTRRYVLRADGEWQEVTEDKATALDLPGLRSL